MDRYISWALYSQEHEPRDQATHRYRRSASGERSDGPATYKETVARALEQVVTARQRAREEIIDLLQSFSEATSNNLGNDETMDSAWR